MQTMTKRTGPKSRRIATERLYRLIWEMNLENDAAFLEEARRHVPDAWLTVEMDLDAYEPKEKVTLYLDRSVARLFKGMGRGYQARINRILATWAQLKIADLKEMEMTHLDALAAARAECEAPPPEGLEDHRAKTLHEHWAYLQGVLDTEVRLAKE